MFSEYESRKQSELENPGQQEDNEQTFGNNKLGF